MTVHERPILFSAPMVRAILAGTKMVTRRIVKLDPDTNTKIMNAFVEYGKPTAAIGAGGHGGLCWQVGDGTYSIPVRCPYGGPGEILWVRETWQPIWSEHRNRRPDYTSSDGWAVGYVATDGIREYRDDEYGLTARCKPAIFMPRCLSRITLEVVDVRVERLQEITEEDAEREGVERDDSPCDHTRQSCKDVGCLGPTFRSSFAELWDKLNAARAPWKSNPWVWRVEFKRVKP